MWTDWQNWPVENACQAGFLLGGQHAGGGHGLAAQPGALLFQLALPSPLSLPGACSRPSAQGAVLCQSMMGLTSSSSSLSSPTSGLS